MPPSGSANARRVDLKFENGESQEIAGIESIAPCSGVCQGLPFWYGTGLQASAFPLALQGSVTPNLKHLRSLLFPSP